VAATAVPMPRREWTCHLPPDLELLAHAGQAEVVEPEMAGDSPGDRHPRRRPDRPAVPVGARR
jgi:hypothetical protein